MKKKKTEQIKIDSKYMNLSIIGIYLATFINIIVTIYQAYILYKNEVAFKDMDLLPILTNKIFIISIYILVIIYLIPVYKKYFKEYGDDELAKKMLFAYIPLLITLKFPSLINIAWIIWIITHFILFNKLKDRSEFCKLIIAMFVSLVLVKFIYMNWVEILEYIVGFIVILNIPSIFLIPFSGDYAPVTFENKTEKENKKDEDIKILEFDSGVKFYRCVGLTGNKYIKQVNFMGSSSICSWDEFDKGKVIIKQNGKQVTFIPNEPK